MNTKSVIELETAARNYHANSIPSADHMAEWQRLKDVLAARRWWVQERAKWRKTGDINARKSMRRAADARRAKR